MIGVLASRAAAGLQAPNVRDTADALAVNLL
jgi:hypothetical protein